MVTSGALISMLAGLFCLSQAPAFWWDWLAATESAEESGRGDSESDGLVGIGALVHAVLAAVLGLGFLVFAAQQVAV